MRVEIITMWFQKELVESELHLLTGSDSLTQSRTVLEPVRVLPSLSDEEVITIFDASWIAMFEHMVARVQTLRPSFLAVPHCSKICKIKVIDDDNSGAVLLPFLNTPTTLHRSASW